MRGGFRPLPILVALALAWPVVAAEPPAAPKRAVLVELYTSQGCDMCPAAEEILGRLAADVPGIVPIAFHVDYFDKPWKDVFSDELYSRRQMTYNDVYAGPKPESYGLYYTPMMMIDGARSVNGRDRAAAVAAIRAARAKPPAVTLDVDLDVAEDGRSGTATLRVSRRPGRAVGSPLLLCAVLREDRGPIGRERRQDAGRAVPRPPHRVRLHRVERRRARIEVVPVRRRPGLEPREPAARLLRPGPDHGGRSSGRRRALAGR